MNFGTWKASTASCQNTITARCTTRMIAKDRADRTRFTEHRAAPSSAESNAIRSLGATAKKSIHPLADPWSASSLLLLAYDDPFMVATPAAPGRPHACGVRASRAALRKSVPKIADKVGVLEKKK